MTVPTLEEIRALIEARERAAYQKGWSDAVTRLLAAAKVEAVPASETGTLVAKRPIGAPKPSRPIVQVILDVIKEKPGLRGAEIFREAVNRVGGADFKKMDRTGRTALARLKRRELIRMRSKRWYPVTETAETTAEAA